MNYCLYSKGPLPRTWEPRYHQPNEVKIHYAGNIKEPPCISSTPSASKGPLPLTSGRGRSKPPVPSKKYTCEHPTPHTDLTIFISTCEAFPFQISQRCVRVPFAWSQPLSRGPPRMRVGGQVKSNAIRAAVCNPQPLPYLGKVSRGSN